MKKEGEGYPEDRRVMMDRLSLYSRVRVRKWWLEEKCKEFVMSVFGEDDVVSGSVNWCRNEKTQRKLPFDIIIKSLKIIIEVDGKQHTQPNKLFNRNISLAEIMERDRYKEGIPLKNGYLVIRIYQPNIVDYFNECEYTLSVVKRCELEHSYPCYPKHEANNSYS